MVPKSPDPQAPAAPTDDPLEVDRFTQAVRDEVTRVLHPPFETLITVALNAALMSSAWFFLPPHLFD